MKEFKSLKDTVETCNKLSQQYDDIETLIEMGYEEEDPDMISEVRNELDAFISILEEIRIGTLHNPSRLEFQYRHTAVITYCMFPQYPLNF